MASARSNAASASATLSRRSCTSASWIRAGKDAPAWLSTPSRAMTASSKRPACFSLTASSRGDGDTERCYRPRPAAAFIR
jgi:hypothetical protein